MTLLRIVAVLLFISLMALCITWQETAVRYERRRLQELDAMLQNRSAKVQSLKAQVARLQSPQRIINIVHTTDIGLRPPGPDLRFLGNQIANLEYEENPAYNRLFSIDVE